MHISNKIRNKTNIFKSITALMKQIKKKYTKLLFFNVYWNKINEQ